jgi:hypothetical protein
VVYLTRVRQRLVPVVSTKTPKEFTHEYGKLRRKARRGNRR